MEDTLIIAILAIILVFLARNTLNEQFKIIYKKPKLVKKVSIKGKKLTPVTKKLTPVTKKLTPVTKKLTPVIKKVLYKNPTSHKNIKKPKTARPVKNIEAEDATVKKVATEQNTETETSE